MTEPKEFIFDEEQLEAWFKELAPWAKKAKLTEEELCIVFGLLHEYLKDKLGVEMVRMDAEEDMH